MSGISWTNATWNPWGRCSLVSPGCTNCYAMTQAWRLAHNPATPWYRGTVQMTKAGAVWTGEVNRAPEHKFREPERWRSPLLIFVNSMSDFTGARRFWPVSCSKRADPDALARERDHLWAEAYVNFRCRGTGPWGDWWLDDAQEAQAEVEQEARRERHPWERRIASYCSTMQTVTTDELMDLLIPTVENQKVGEKTLIGKILKAQGWRRWQRSDGSRCYLRPASLPPVSTSNLVPFPGGPIGQP